MIRRNQKTEFCSCCSSQVKPYQGFYCLLCQKLCCEECVTITSGKAICSNCKSKQKRFQNRKVAQRAVRKPPFERLKTFTPKGSNPPRPVRDQAPPKNNTVYYDNGFVSPRQRPQRRASSDPPLRTQSYSSGRGGYTNFSNRHWHGEDKNWDAYNPAEQEIPLEQNFDAADSGKEWKADNDSPIEVEAKNSEDLEEKDDQTSKTWESDDKGVAYDTDREAENQSWQDFDHDVEGKADEDLKTATNTAKEPRLFKQPVNNIPINPFEDHPSTKPKLPSDDNCDMADLKHDFKGEGLNRESQKFSDHKSFSNIKEKNLTPQELADIAAVPSDCYYPDPENLATSEQDNVTKVNWQDLNTYDDNVLQMELDAQTPADLGYDQSNIASFSQNNADFSYANPANFDIKTEKLKIDIATPQSDRDDVRAANLEFEPLE